MNPLTALPAKARRAIYVFYATLGIAFGATQVGYATAQADQPMWLLIAFGVFGYLGTALGLVAAANVQTDGLTSAQLADYEQAFAQREAAARHLAEHARAGADEGAAALKPQLEAIQASIDQLPALMATAVRQRQRQAGK